MFFTYVLVSESTGRYYIGSTGNIEDRLEHHNAGRTKLTKGFRLWRLIHQEEYDTLPHARNRESLLKSWKSRSYLESQLHLIF